MTPKKAVRYMVLLIAVAILLAFLFIKFLSKLDSPVLNILFFIFELGIIAVFSAIQKKYYVCTHCGRSLKVGRMELLATHCPHCKEEIE